MKKSYFVRIDGIWHLFEGCDSIYDMVIQVADFVGINSHLFYTAIRSCDDSECIPMYNVFANAYDAIQSVWQLNTHIYGSAE